MEQVRYLVSVQCRFGSSRLPGKALYPIAGVPLLPFLLRRLKAGLAGDPCRIALCTTSLPEDDITAAWGKNEGVAVVRGAKDDVLARHVQTLTAYPASVHVRVTADNPFTCPELVKAVVRQVYEEGADYAECRDFPYGAGADAFSQTTMQRLDTLAVTPADREHINKYILDNSEAFTTQYVQAKGRLQRPDLRVTVDTLEDWRQMDKLASILAQHQDAPPWERSLEAAIAAMS